MTMMDDVFKTVSVSQLPETRGPKPTSALINSIRFHGLLTPIVVRKDLMTGEYRVVDGMRRLAAVREIGLEKVNVIQLNEHSVREAAELTLVMNHARSENPLAEVEALENLRHFTDNDIREHTGIGKAALATRFVWMTVGPDVLNAYNDGRVSMTAVTALGRAPESVRETFRKIVQNGGKFVAAEVEQAIEHLNPPVVLTPKQQRDADIRKLTNAIATAIDELRRLYEEIDRLELGRDVLTKKIEEVIRKDPAPDTYGDDWDDVPF